MQGGCSKEKDLSKRLDVFVDDASFFCKYFSKLKEARQGVVSMEKIAPRLAFADCQVVAAEVTIKMPTTTWKQRVHVIRKKAEESLWLVDYGGFEPAFSRYDKAVAASLKSFRLPE